MSEAEFWGATLAQVVMLEEVKVQEWDRTRDYFPASLLSAFLGSKGAKTPGGQDFTADMILKSHYRGRKEEQRDPDKGASGDWMSLKSALKQATAERKDRKAKLRPFNPNQKV